MFIEQPVEGGAHRVEPSEITGTGDMQFVGHHYSTDRTVRLDQTVADIEIKYPFAIGQRGERGIGLTDRFVPLFLERFAARQDSQEEDLARGCFLLEGLQDRPDTLAISSGVKPALMLLAPMRRTMTFGPTVSSTPF